MDEVFTYASSDVRRNSAFCNFFKERSFWKWISVFGLLGLVIPAIYFFHVIVFVTPIAGFNMEKWWPTSIAFMWADFPNPSMMTIAVIIVVAVFGNVVLYAMLGILSWPVLLVLRQISSKRTPRPC